MGRVIIEIPQDVYSAIIAHLLPEEPIVEEAAFVFAQIYSENTETVFRFQEWEPVPSQGFSIQSAYYMELTDETGAAVIKKAHDLGACIVEFHSHLSERPAGFSESDIWGLTDFVPHVRWRLRGKPYAAVVVARDSFDALAWVSKNREATSVDGIFAGRVAHRPTGISLPIWQRGGREYGPLR